MLQVASSRMFLYTVAVYLLSALDNVSECGKKKRHEQAQENGLKPAEKGLKPAEKSLEPAEKSLKSAKKAEEDLTSAEKTTLANAAKVAMSHLDKLEEYVKRTGVTTAIRYYLIVVAVGVGRVGTRLFIYMRFEFAGSSKLFVTTIAAGAIGSVASVMFRITRGQTLSVNIDQGGPVTIINGAFRPLVGAVFGVALYILVQGQLLPLDDPGEVQTRIQQFFYAGLAFLAGFSERWAQDTILQSRPLVPLASEGGTGVTAAGVGAVQVARLWRNASGDTKMNTALSRARKNVFVNARLSARSDQPSPRRSCTAQCNESLIASRSFCRARSLPVPLPDVPLVPEMVSSPRHLGLFRGP